MKRYCVTIERIVRDVLKADIVVTAETPEGAIERAEDLIDSGEYEGRCSPWSFFDQIESEKPTFSAVTEVPG